MIGELFEDALASGRPVELEHADGTREVLPVHRWSGGLLGGDQGLVDRSSGSTLDVGCGPGRLAAAASERGLPVLGIDVAAAAVACTTARGALALQRDVFGPLPGDGRWQTVLLADGNIGIGGDPERLLRRLVQLMAPGGHALVELTGQHAGRGTSAVRLRRGRQLGEWFRWAEVGDADLAPLAERAGLRVIERWTEARRWFACLQ